MAGHASDYASLLVNRFASRVTLLFTMQLMIMHYSCGECHSYPLCRSHWHSHSHSPWHSHSLPPSFAISRLYPTNPQLIDRIIKPTLRVNITLRRQSKTTSPIRAKDSQIRLELSSNSPPARAAHRLFSKSSPRRLHRVGQGVLLSRCIDSRVRPEDNRYLRRVVDSCARETLSVRERCVEVVAPDRVPA
jgi:hypothetical protein